jgi:AraC family transcriptional regulator of adaptative response/methylated-DNA-[protein]-cysteine methyltransferase
MSENDPQDFWAAIVGRDRNADGRFIYGVTTTGIYCRPSCPARRPAPAHLRYFADGAQAREAGFRACLRCQPDGVSREARAVAQAIAQIEQAETPPRLADLADATGYSPSHFQRIFTRATGLSPAAYARAQRMERLRELLPRGTVTAAIYEAGFGGPSALYAGGQERLGMTPSAWAKGGAGVEICWAIVESTLGPLLIAASPRGICRIAFGAGRDDVLRMFPQATLIEGFADPALLARVVAAVEAPGQGHDLPLDVRGTAFQEAVWRALQAIPPGETRSYAQIAAAVGRPRATRAAGSANGANPVAVLIPCHRVIRGDGGAGGYAWGLEIKAQLLAREGVQTKE